MSRRRDLLATLALLTMFVWPVGVAAAQTPPTTAPAAGGDGGIVGQVCNAPVVSWLCSGGDQLAALAGTVAQLPGQIAAIPGQVSGAVLATFSAWMVDGAVDALTSTGDAILGTTTVTFGTTTGTGQPGDTWFTGHYQTMAALAGLLLLPMLLLAVLTGLFQQSLQPVIRALVNLPIATIGTAAAITVVDLALGATDWASSRLLAGTGDNTRALLDGIANGLRSMVTQPGAAPGSPGLVAVLLAGFAAFTALVIWLELVVREAAIYLSVLFLPLAFATFVWPTVSVWLRRLVEVIAALVLSKLVIVAALSLASAATASGDGVGVVVSGVAMLLIAAYSPFALFRLIPIATMAGIASLEGLNRRGMRAATPRATTAFYGMNMVRSHSTSRAATGAGGAAAAGAGVAATAASTVAATPMRAVRGTGSAAGGTP